jgi:hypothetical protein
MPIIDKYEIVGKIVLRKVYTLAALADRRSRTTRVTRPPAMRTRIGNGAEDIRFFYWPARSAYDNRRSHWNKHLPLASGTIAWLAC